MKHIILITLVVFLAGCCRRHHQPEFITPYCEFKEHRTENCFGRVPHNGKPQQQSNVRTQPWVHTQQQFQPQCEPCMHPHHGGSAMGRNVMTTTESFVDPHTGRLITVNVNVAKPGSR